MGNSSPGAVATAKCMNSSAWLHDRAGVSTSTERGYGVFTAARVFFSAAQGLLYFSKALCLFAGGGISTEAGLFFRLRNLEAMVLTFKHQVAERSSKFIGNRRRQNMRSCGGNIVWANRRIVGFGDCRTIAF